MDWDQVRRDLINASAELAAAAADATIKTVWGEAARAVGYAAEGFGIPREAVAKLTDAVDTTLRKAATEGIKWAAGELGGGVATVEPVADTPDGGGSTPVSIFDSESPFVQGMLEASLGVQAMKDYRDLRSRLNSTVRLPDAVASNINRVCAAIDAADAEEAANAGQGFDPTSVGAGADPFGDVGGPAGFADIEAKEDAGGLDTGACINIGAVRALRADTRALARTLGMTEGQCVLFLRAFTKMSQAFGQLETIYDADGSFMLEE